MARRSLPAGGKVPEDYAFHGLGADGQPTTVRLSELFREGGDAVVLYQMIFPRFSSDTRVTGQERRNAKTAREGSAMPVLYGVARRVEFSGEALRGRRRPGLTW